MSIVKITKGAYFFLNQINRETNQLFTRETQVKETVQNNTSPCIWKLISNHF